MPESHLRFPRRAPETHHADADSPSHAFNEWLQQEVGESLGDALPLLRLYNFVRIHRTLRITLAMAAGGTDRL